MHIKLPMEENDLLIYTEIITGLGTLTHYGQCECQLYTCRKPIFIDYELDIEIVII